ncbi:MAG: hypothetical protein HYZ53_14760 [Planctomycetes bacterium]|nr:hypothetical protein [Planctomycetota bacterium]
MTLVLLAILLVGSSGFAGLLVGRAWGAGERIAAALHCVGGACGLAALLAPASAFGDALVLPWSIPEGEFSVGLDGLSALFLAPLFLISSLGSIYGLAYWREADHPESGRRLRVFYGLLTAGLALLVVARNAWVFLLGWEFMAVSAFLLITSEDHEKTVREAGLLYVFCTHVGTLLLFALFALMRHASGTWAFVPLGGVATASPATAGVIFLLALGAFGMKAGAMPLHVWLPSAHACAPSHVSAVMSGVLIKMGVYGLARICSLFPSPPAWWGATIFAVGLLSGVLGVAFAIGQHDIKRLLAYHSIENIGIIFLGLGLGLVGRSLHRPELIALGLGGSLLHVWNHGLFKALLFFSAGSVMHSTGTRALDRLGGLAKGMPRTALCFLLGAVAICGLPPLNGFVSEFLLYLGFLRSVASAESGDGLWIGAAFSAPALALIGALALACFAKVYGAVFLGEPRTDAARRAHDPGALMTVPMGILAGACVLIGLAPALVTPALDGAIAAWSAVVPPAGAASVHAPPQVASLAPLGWLSAMAALLLALLAGGAAFLHARTRGAAAEPVLTWDCGYAAPSPTMQYTSSSFAQSLVDLFAWALRPRAHAPRLTAIFPPHSEFESHVPDTVLDHLLAPACRRLADAATWFRWVQQGNTNAYLFYILLTVLVLLLWR